MRFPSTTSVNAGSPPLPRGVHEILILATLQQEAKHGYQIALEIEEGSGGYFTLNHGTLYPILHQLEKEELIHGEWDDGGSRRRRKEYRLTAAGRERLHARLDDWRELDRCLSAFALDSDEHGRRSAGGIVQTVLTGRH